VLPGSDGICPSCHQNTREAADDPERTSIRVNQGDLLPDVCAQCGGHAEGYMQIYRSSSEANSASSRFLGMTIGLLFPWLQGSTLLSQDGQADSVVQVEIPLCSSCAKSCSPEPRYVDFRNARMTFVVRKQLREAIEHWSN
jgi:hypothetical protein